MKCFGFSVIAAMMFITMLTSCDKDESGDKFIVSFHSNGGSAVKRQTVKLFERVVKPKDPTRKGDLFFAWYRDVELKNEWDFSWNFVVSHLTLYAAWQSVDPSFKIGGLTIDNYPRVDGSTSTSPLNILVACKLLNIGYRWKRDVPQNTQSIMPNLNDNSEKFWKQVKSSQTHDSFINLINNDTDLILSARKISPDEKEYADAQGVELTETPIALDAFIFTLHPNNPVRSLTIKQIQDIYTCKITNWKEVGGRDAKINPYLRNANSGSQELFEMLVMKDIDISDFPVSSRELVINSMVGVFDVVTKDPDAICYTIYYYKEQMITETNVVTAAIEGVSPNKETISDNSYPLVADVFAIIRSDLDKSSMAFKLYELLQTQNGKQVIGESGYLPI